MASMSLGSPIAGGMVYRGPMFAPGAAAPPGAGAAGTTQPAIAPTLATRAWGISASPQGGGARTAHWGVVGSAVVSAGLLWFMWWTLPR